MKITNGAKVGIFVVLVLILLAALTIKTGNFSLAKKGIMVKIHFKNIDGVDKNAPVLLQGFEVGVVKDIRIMEQDHEKFMELDVQLEDGVQLNEGTHAYVKNLGFMGEKYIGLTFGDKEGAQLMEGSVIPGGDVADLDKILRDGQEIVAEIKSISHNINERLEKNKESIDRIVTNLDATMLHVNSLTAALDERFGANEQNIDEIFINAKSATKNMDMFTHDLKENPWKLLYRPKEKRDANLGISK
jgi:ABC-type transporter Mla subunit MlaD